jgi:MFS family permease
MSSFSMLLPELPSYLRAMGGEEYVGLIVGVFTLNAFFSRFFSGRIADESGRVKVILIGTVVTALAGFSYLFATSLWLFFLIRFFHGISTGFRPTGTTALLSDMVPFKRRGEAMGYLGVAGNSGMALGPVFGSLIRVEFGFDALFITSGVFGILALILSLFLTETLPKPKPIQLRHFNIFKGQLFDLASWPAAVSLLPIAFSFGIFLTISPDFVGALGFTYRGAFNTTIVFSSVAARLIAGKASDKYGRIPVLMIGNVLMCIGMAVIGFAESTFVAILGGVIYGLSNGINMPTIFAWAIDFAKPGKTALALGTMLMALEVGIGLGAVVSGFMYGDVLQNIPSTYFLGAVLGVAGIFSLIAIKKRYPDSHVGS